MSAPTLIETDKPEVACTNWLMPVSSLAMACISSERLAVSGVRKGLKIGNICNSWERSCKNCMISDNLISWLCKSSGMLICCCALQRKFCSFPPRSRTGCKPLLMTSTSFISWVTSDQSVGDEEAFGVAIAANEIVHGMNGPEWWSWIIFILRPGTFKENCIYKHSTWMNK